MTTIERTIHIEAPPEKVFSYIDDPLHLPEIWPSMVEVEDVERLPNGGRRYEWEYKMAGIHFEGVSETVTYEPGRHVVEKNTAGIPSTFDWTFTPENGGTRLELKTEYEIPHKVLGKFAEPFVRKLNEREADTVLANLKDRMES